MLKKSKKNRSLQRGSRGKIGKFLTGKTHWYNYLSLFILVILGLLFIYQQAKKSDINANNKQNITKTGYGNPSLTPTPEIETPIKTKPREAYISNMKKDVVSYNMCGNTVGMVVYSLDNMGSMTITSPTLKISEEVKKSLQLVQLYLNGQSYTPETSVSDLEIGFHFACGGYGSAYIRDISISYPGTDKARAFMSMTGQDPWGTIMVAVFAQKDDEFILLRSFLSDKSLYKKYFDQCPNDDYQCYRQAVFADPFLEELAIRNAQGLIATFRL